MSKVFYVRQSAVLPSSPEDKEWREIQHCRWLTESSKDVELVCSSFDHYKKAQRVDFGQFVDFNVRCLWTPGYRSNKSVMRLFDAAFFSIRLFFYLLWHAKPGAKIICSYPTPESVLACIIISRLTRCSIHIDFRDSWPRAFGTSGIASKVFASYLGITNKLIFKILKDNELLYMSGGMASYYEQYISRPIVTRDKNIIPNAKPHGVTTCSEVDRSNIFLFFGTLNDQFTFDPIAKYVKEDNSQVQFLIAGSGNNLPSLQSGFYSCSSVSILGQVPYEKLLGMISTAQAIFLFYKDPDVFENHLTNKIVEALSFGKIIVHNLKSNFFTIGLKQYQLGISIHEQSLSSVIEKIQDESFSDDRLEVMKLLDEKVLKASFIEYALES